MVEDQDVGKRISIEFNVIAFANEKTELFLTGNAEELGEWTTCVKLGRVTAAEDIRDDFESTPALYRAAIDIPILAFPLAYKFKMSQEGAEAQWETDFETSCGNRRLTFDSHGSEAFCNQHVNSEMMLTDDFLLKGQKSTYFHPPVHFRVSSEVTEPVQTTAYFRQVVQAGKMDYHRINEQIYLGSSPRSTEHLRFLKEELGVSALVNLQTEEDVSRYGAVRGTGPKDYRRAVRDAGLGLIWLPTEDMCSSGRANMVADAAALMKAHLKKKGSRVYVHCNAGVGRSTAAVAGYLSYVQGMSLEEVHRFLTEKRPIVYFDKHAYVKGTSEYQRKYATE